MQMLAEGYRRRNRARPDLFAEGRERGLRTVREYDDRITAPFGGYESAAQYYERSSAGPGSPRSTARRSSSPRPTTR